MICAFLKTWQFFNETLYGFKLTRNYSNNNKLFNFSDTKISLIADERKGKVIFQL